MVLLISRATNLIAFPKPITQPDSSGYASTTIFDFSLVSLVGNSLRSWPSPLLFALMPSEVAKVMGQMMISILVWTYLGYVLLKLFRSNQLKNILLITLVVFSTNPALLQWETVLLGQSLLISNFILLIALFVEIKFNYSRSVAILSIVSCTFLFLQKSSNIFVTLFFLIYFIFNIYKSSNKLFTLKLVSLFLLLFTYSALVNINVDKNWGTISYSGYATLYHLGAQSPAAPEVSLYLATIDDVPKCILSGAPYLDIGQSIKNIKQSCPESHKYISKNLSRDLFGYYFSNPKSLVKLISIGFGASFSQTAAHYGNVVSVLPSSVYDLVNGGTTPDFRIGGSKTQVEALSQINVGEPIWVYIPGAIWIGISIILFLYRSYGHKKAAHEGLFVILILLLSVNSVLTYIIVPTEWVRLSMPNTTIAIMIALVHLIYVYQNQKTNSNSLSDPLK